MNPIDKNRIKAAMRMRDKLGIQWWWQWLTTDDKQLNDEWNKKTDNMSLEEFRADWQDSAFDYEFAFRDPKRARFPIKVPWIDLTLQQRQQWRSSYDPSHVVRAFGNEPAPVIQDGMRCGLQTLLNGQKPARRAGFSPWLRLNLTLPKKRLLELLDKAIIEMQSEQRDVAIIPVKGGRPHDQWYEIELLDEEREFSTQDRLLVDTSRLSKAKRRFKV